MKVLSHDQLGRQIYASPVAANGTLYIASRRLAVGHPPEPGKELAHPRRASPRVNAAQAASEAAFTSPQFRLYCKASSSSARLSVAVLEFQRDFHARIAHQIDRAVLADQLIELAEQAVLDGLTHQVAAGGRDLMGPLAQAIGRPLGQGRQIFAGNVDDLGNVSLICISLGSWKKASPRPCTPPTRGGLSARRGLRRLYHVLAGRGERFHGFCRDSRTTGRLLAGEAWRGGHGNRLLTPHFSPYGDKYNSGVYRARPERASKSSAAGTPSTCASGTSWW